MKESVLEECFKKCIAIRSFSFEPDAFDTRPGLMGLQSIQTVLDYKSSSKYDYSSFSSSIL